MSVYAFERIGPKRYQERWGLDFREFRIGQRIRHRPGVTVSQQDNADEALDTFNAAMLHYDAHYASKTAWRQPLMVSTITLQRLIGMASRTFGRKRRIPVIHEIAMTSPVFGGDTLYAESEILAMEPGPEVGMLRVRTEGFNQERKIVARIEYTVEVWMPGRHPSDAGRRGVEPAAEPRFAFFREDADGVLTEQYGLFFEDAEPGESFVHAPRRHFSREEAIEHARRSLELNPQYHDLDWIDRHEGGRYRIGEAWVISAATATSTRTFGRVVANLGWTDIRLPIPVYAGDTVEAESTIVEKRESKSRPNEGILTVDTRARNQGGDEVLSYQRRLLVYRRTGETPYAAAGY